jgi:hypothetical protein
VGIFYSANISIFTLYDLRTSDNRYISIGLLGKKIEMRKLWLKIQTLFNRGQGHLISEILTIMGKVINGTAIDYIITIIPGTLDDIAVKAIKLVLNKYAGTVARNAKDIDALKAIAKRMAAETLMNMDKGEKQPLVYYEGQVDAVYKLLVAGSGK